MEVAPISTPSSRDGTNLPPPRTCAPTFITVKLVALFRSSHRSFMTDLFTPASRAIFEKQVLAHVPSLDADGAPNVTPVWVMLDGDDIVINTALGRAKARNLASDSRVAVSLVDPDDEDSIITLRGSVVGFTTIGAEEGVDR